MKVPSMSRHCTVFASSTLKGTLKFLAINTWQFELGYTLTVLKRYNQMLCQQKQFNLPCFYFKYLLKGSKNGNILFSKVQILEPSITIVFEARSKDNTEKSASVGIRRSSYEHLTAILTLS
jgi:hypothetical protein